MNRVDSKSGSSMAKIKLDSDLIIHYSDLNSRGRPVILLLHGLGANGDSWFYQFEPLVDSGYRVLAPDLRGFGRSSYPGVPNSPHLMAEDMVRMLSKLNISSAILLGISMGGTVALEMALNHPTLAESLILVNTFSKIRPRNPSIWLMYAYRYFLVNSLGIPIQARYVCNKLFPRSDQEYLRNTFYDQVVQANPDGYRTAMRSFASFNVDHKLKEIGIPTLVVTGAEDSVVSPDIQTHLAENIPNAEHVIIRDSNHAVIVEKPEEFNSAMIDFLQRTLPVNRPHMSKNN